MKVRGDFLGPPRSTDKTTLISQLFISRAFLSPPPPPPLDSKSELGPHESTDKKDCQARIAIFGRKHVLLRIYKCSSIGSYKNNLTVTRLHLRNDSF